MSAVASAGVVCAGQPGNTPLDGLVVTDVRTPRPGGPAPDAPVVTDVRTPRPGGPPLDGPVVTNAPSARPGGPPRWQRFAGVGDSVIAGIGDPADGYADASWLDQVVDLLGPDAVSANLGVVGLRAAAIRETQLDQALAFRPDLVALSAGGNDMFARDFDETAVAADVEAMVRAFRRIDADVVMFGFYRIDHLLPVPLAVRERLAGNNGQLAAITRDVALRHGAIHIDNSHRQVDPALMSADGIHFNRRGHAHLAAIVAEVLGLAAR